MEKVAGATLAQIESAYRVHAQRFHRLAWSLLGDEQAAWDAVQEGVARAVRARDSYRQEGPVEAWLWRSVLNSSRSMYRREAARHRLEREAVCDLAGGSPKGTHGDASTDADAVRAAVTRLSERQQTVLFLRYYADLELIAIAEIIGVRRGTVSATLVQAQARLRSLLEGVGDDA